MCHELLRGARFFALLRRFDEDLAAEARARGCQYCGAPLHEGSYPRKPRGGPDELGPGYDRRLSFCCANRDCRKRLTPPSVRFLGRKVYLGAVVVLITAMLHGATPPRLAKLEVLIGASPRTVARWRAWWQTTFAETPFWRSAAGRFAEPVERERLPLSLLERFGGDVEEQLVALLRFVAPITTASAGEAIAF